MNWLKRNLFLVAGGLVALGLLGFAIFFLVTKKQAVDEVTSQLNTQTEALKGLVNRDPHPNQENIEAARKEQKKLAEFIEHTRRFFVPVASYTNMDDSTFKGLLQTAIFDMEHDAEKAGVSLPAVPAGKYDFTFKPQRQSVVFAPETLVPLAMEVAEIKSICDVLFDARINALTGLRRMPVAKEDDGTADYLVGRKPATNSVTGAVLAPYEIKFQGFSTELAAVLEGFYRSSNCFIVKNVDVQTNVVTTATDSAPGYVPSFLYPAGPSAAPEPRISPMDMMRRRYGLGPNSRYSPQPGPTPTPPPVLQGAPVRRGPETVLDEHPFTVTMYVEAVRWIERAKPKTGK